MSEPVSGAPAHTPPGAELDGPVLDGKVAIVTGGGRGLGRAIAEAYLRAGARVVVTAAREGAELDAVVAPWGAGRAIAVVADVSDPAACEAVVERAAHAFGAVDVLVNNAGRGMKYVSDDFLERATQFWETDPAVWRLVVETNVNGPFFMARAAVRWMLAHGPARGRGGSVVSVSMNYETMKRRGFSPYGPSKTALESASVIWAQELAPHGIRLNVLLPGGATETGMIPAGTPAEVRTRLLRPEVIAGLAIYLASDRSAHLTGHRLVATEWSPDRPDGRPAGDGIGA